MKKTTKVLAGVLAVAMLIPMLGGCSQKANTDGVTKVTWWRSNGHDKAFMQGKFKEFNETVGKEMGIELEYVTKEGNMEEMVDLAYTSDQAPDLYNSYQIEMRAQKDQIIALEDIPGTEALLEKFGGRAMETRHKYKGKTYILPLTSGTYGLIYNKEMFVDAGIVDENGEAKPPVTWADVVDYAKRLTDVSKQHYGMIFPGKWWGFHMTDINMASSAINGMTDAYNPVDGRYYYDAQAKVMKAMVQMVRDGSVVPGIESLDNDPARARFGQGGIGMKIAGSYDVGVLNDQFPAEIEWGVAPLPLWDENEKGMQYCSADGLFVVNKESYERIGAEKLVAIMEFFSSDEMLIDRYTAGLSIPCDFNLVKDVEVSDDLKNWEIFASFTQFSQCPPVQIKSDMTGKDSIGDIVLKILNETPDDAEIDRLFKEYEDAQNEGIAKYKELNPDYDASPFIYPDWKLMR